MPKGKPVSDGKMTHREFILAGIKGLRKPGYAGIHVVYSGFNGAFRNYFKDEPREYVDKLVKEGVVVSRPCKGGVMIMLAEDAKGLGTPGNDPDVALAKILRQQSR